MDINMVTILGNVGKDPEVRTFQNGGKVCNFSVATSRKYTDKAGDRKEITEWHNVVVQDPKLIETAEKYIQKGTRVFLVGEVMTRKWEKDGATKYATEIVVPRFNGRLGIEARGKEKADAQPAASDNGNASNMDNDDIPF